MLRDPHHLASVDSEYPPAEYRAGMMFDSAEAAAGDAHERVADEVRASVIKSVTESYDAAVRGAADTWGSGHVFYVPALPLLPNREGYPGQPDVGRALEMITAVGWRLHTWTVTERPHTAPLPFVYAHPLFVRDTSPASAAS